MQFSTGAVALWCLSVGSASAFSTNAKTVAFVGRSGSAVVGRTQHSAGCACPACVSLHPAGCSCTSCIKSTHSSSCLCSGCRRGTSLFADVAATDEAEGEVSAEELPAEVEALDGVESPDEAHNVERPARSALKKKKSTAIEISDLKVGSMVTGTVRTITNYGAFIDIGASTDGLLHISQLSTEYVGDVNDVLKGGQEVEVRIASVDTAKGQVALSLITAEEASSSQGGGGQRGRPQQSNRRDDNAVLSALNQKGWDSSAFVTGTVVSTVDFGCFVRVDASLLNSECEGEFDGLVHISALANRRVSAVTDVANVDDKVAVRVKSIAGSKVSLTMLSTEDEESKNDFVAGGGGPREGAKDWKESLEKLSDKMPVFKNGPVVDDRRKA